MPLLPMVAMACPSPPLLWDVISWGAYSFSSLSLNPVHGLAHLNHLEIFTDYRIPSLKSMRVREGTMSGTEIPKLRFARFTHHPGCTTAQVKAQVL